MFPIFRSVIAHAQDKAIMFRIKFCANLAKIPDAKHVILQNLIRV
jgi:hypothetical protein